MLFKSVTASVLLLALTSSVNAAQDGCLITPALGASNPGPSDIQQPSDSAPCGKISIPQNIDSSNSVTADSNGKFTVTATNFVAGNGGSQSMKSVMVSADGTGNFKDVNVVTNGPAAPSGAGSQQLSFQLPSGTQCAAGKDNKCCVVSFITTAGYGNCAMVCQTESTGKTSTTTEPAKTKADTQGDQTKTGTQNGDQANQKQQQSQNPSGGNNSKNQKRMIRKRRL